MTREDILFHVGVALDMLERFDVGDAVVTIRKDYNKPSLSHTVREFMVMETTHG